MSLWNSTAVQVGGNKTTGSQASLSFNTSSSVTAGNLVVVTLAATSATDTSLVQPTISDQHGNTYHSATPIAPSTIAISDGNNEYLLFYSWYLVAPTSATLDITVTPHSSSVMSMSVAEFSYSGLASISVAISNGVGGGTYSGTGQSMGTTAGSPTVAGPYLTVCFGATNDAQVNNLPAFALSPGGSYTQIFSDAFVPSSGYVPGNNLTLPNVNLGFLSEYLANDASPSSSGDITFTGATAVFGLASVSFSLVSNFPVSATDSATFTNIAGSFDANVLPASNFSQPTARIGTPASRLGLMVPGFLSAPLVPPTGAVRVSQFAVEVLMTPPKTWAVSAHDTANFTTSAALNAGRHVAASSSATFTTSASANVPRVYRVSASASAVFSSLIVTTEVNTFQASAKDSATFGDQAVARVPKTFIKNVHDSATFATSARCTSFPVRYAVSVSASATFTDSAPDPSFLRSYQVLADDKAAFTDLPTIRGVLRSYRAAASDQATFSTYSNWNVLHDVSPGGPQDQGRFTDRAAASRLMPRPAAASATFTTAATVTRLWAVAATSSATFTTTAKSNGFPGVAATSSATFTTVASATVERLGCKVSATFTDGASANVLLASGLLVPGGDMAAGLRSVLYSPVSAAFPFSYAEAADGLVMMANGMDPMLAWDGLEGQAWAAGLAAPEGCCWINGSGVGLFVGQRWAYVRYVDRWGNMSNLNQVSDPVSLGRDGLISSVSSPSGTAIITSALHGLSSGSSVIIQGVASPALVNGQWTITVIDANTFTLNSLALGPATYTGGGSWTQGSSSVQYSNLPLPASPNVTRRQILRNLQGNADVFYVDIDTTDLTSVTLSSTRSDEQLAAQLAVPIDFDDQMPSANRFYVPPSHKCSLAAYAGRVFATTDMVYSTGNVSVTLGSPAVVGIGTAFTAQLAGRLLYVQGSTKAQVIQSVMVAQQILVLETGYQGPSNTIAFYSIRPQPVERRLVYYSEPNNPAAWPPWNAFVCPESSDEITGIFSMRSFLFILKQYHVYKFAYKEDPGKDGYMFQVIARGCVNNRCYAYADNLMYVLDEAGIYSFDGDAADPVSAQVQVLFKPDGIAPYRIDWTTDRTFWSCVHDPARETIRWFVDLVGKPSLTTAICYDYRNRQWWLEQFAEAVTASALAVVSGFRQSVVGTTARRVYCLGQGTLDGIAEDAPGTSRGTVSASDNVSLTDATASFPSNLAGVPVVVVSGTGAGQQRVISSNTSQELQLVQPWATLLDSTSVYQVGGVAFMWKTGWRRLAEDEAENVRDVELVFAPTATPATISLSSYFDHSAVPAIFGYDRDNDGITAVDGSSSAIVDMTLARGYVIQRLTGHRDPYGYGHRYVAIQLAGVQGVDAARVYQLVINGAE